MTTNPIIGFGRANRAALCASLEAMGYGDEVTDAITPGVLDRATWTDLLDSPTARLALARDLDLITYTAEQHATGEEEATAALFGRHLAAEVMAWALRDAEVEEAWRERERAEFAAGVRGLR